MTQANVFSPIYMQFLFW